MTHDVIFRLLVVIYVFGVFGTGIVFSNNAFKLAEFVGVILLWPIAALILVLTAIKAGLITLGKMGWELLTKWEV